MNIWEKIVNDLSKKYPQCVKNGVVDLNDILDYLHVETNTIEMLKLAAAEKEVADVEFMQNILNEVMDPCPAPDFTIPNLKEATRIIQETLDEVNKIHAAHKNRITVVLA
jgi:hypothetical protein